MADAKYNTPEHRAAVAYYQQLVADGLAWCAETRCMVEEAGGSRYIPPGTPVHAAHTDDGQAYKGPAHPRCNTSDGGRRRHAKPPTPRRLVL